MSDKDNAWTESNGEPYWPWMAKNVQKEFDSAMMMQESVPPEMVPHFPHADYEIKPGGVRLVDIGGGKGQKIKQIIASNPPMQGKFILQDLPGTISSLAPIDYEGIFEPTIHDFFTAQPVKGAKFYFLRHVLHDWNDAKVVKILKAQRDALEPGYSQLLIEESVLPERGTDPFIAGADLLMMKIVDGQERTLANWTAVLEQAGYKIVKLWPAAGGRTSVIEAELA